MRFRVGDILREEIDPTGEAYGLYLVLAVSEATYLIWHAPVDLMYRYRHDAAHDVFKALDSFI